jgi:hypothetical protein
MLVAHKRIGVDMTIRKKQKQDKIVIDLAGPQGNAFYLLAVVKKTFARSGAHELGESICEEMKKGDYEHLIKTFDLYLGDHFILER